MHEGCFPQFTGGITIIVITAIPQKFTLNGHYHILLNVEYNVIHVKVYTQLHIIYNTVQRKQNTQGYCQRYSKHSTIQSCAHKFIHCKYLYVLSRKKNKDIHYTKSNILYILLITLKFGFARSYTLTISGLSAQSPYCGYLSSGIDLTSCSQYTHIGEYFAEYYNFFYRLLTRYYSSVDII